MRIKTCKKVQIFKILKLTATADVYATKFERRKIFPLSALKRNFKNAKFLFARVKKSQKYH